MSDPTNKNFAVIDKEPPTQCANPPIPTAPTATAQA